MIRTSEVSLNVREFGKEFFLTSINPDWKYENGKRTDERNGTKYEVAIAALRLEKINVKIQGEQFLSDELLADKKMMKVAFDNLIAHFYVVDNRVGITATASAIKIVE